MQSITGCQLWIIDLLTEPMERWPSADKLVQERDDWTMFWTTNGLVESDRWDTQNQAWSHHKCAKPLTHGWMVRTIGIDNRAWNTTAIPSITPSLSRHPLLSAWRNSPSLEPRQIIRNNWSTMLRLDVISSWLDADRSVHHRRTQFRRKQWIPKWNDIWQQQKHSITGISTSESTSCNQESSTKASNPKKLNPRIGLIDPGNRDPANHWYPHFRAQPDP